MVTTDPHRGAAVARAGERPLGDPLHSDRDERVVDPRIDRDDRVGLTSASAHHGRHPIPPQPHTRPPLRAARSPAPSPTSPRWSPRTRAATPQRRVELVGDRDRAGHRDHRVVGEGGTNARWCTGGPPRRSRVVPSPRCPPSRPAAAVAHRFEPLQAEAAMSARRRERQHHAVATASWVDPSHVLDHRTPLVAQHDRQRDRPRTVDVGQVAVADAGGEQAHQHLATAWRLELDLDHLRRRTDLCEHGRSGTDSH